MEYGTTSEKQFQEDVTQLSVDEICRLGAQQMLKHSLEAEIQQYLDSVADRKLADGKAEVVRNGYSPTRNIQTQNGTISVNVPRTRNRNANAENFVSRILPPYMRRSPQIDEALPVLYLYGISSGEMEEVAQTLFGAEFSDSSASTVSRLKQQWIREHDQWRSRSLEGAEYCYLWVDGIYFNTRFGDNRLCIFVAVGARQDGRKELVAVDSGYRESGESWAAFLRQLSSRGMPSPRLIIADGNLGIWKAAGEIFPEASWQRCWVHKTANVLDKLPKSVQKQAKTQLREIYLAPNRRTAEQAFDTFINMFQTKYPKATDCLYKDRDSLMAFFSFPAAHWQHIRSTNAIESTFSTVRLRTDATRGQGTEKTTLAMVFKLTQAAARRWRRLRGYRLLPKVMAGVKFVDGEEQMPQESVA